MKPAILLHSSVRKSPSLKQAQQMLRLVDELNNKKIIYLFNGEYEVPVRLEFEHENLISFNFGIIFPDKTADFLHVSFCPDTSHDVLVKIGQHFLLYEFCVVGVVPIYVERKDFNVHIYFHDDAKIRFAKELADESRTIVWRRSKIFEKIESIKYWRDFLIHKIRGRPTCLMRRS